MKRFLYILFICCFTLLSCKKEFLTLVPQSQATDVAFYKTTADINTAVTGAYSPLQNMYMGTFITMMEARGDNIEDLNPGSNAGTQYNIDRFLAKADNTDIDGTWASIYNAISRCNNTLVHMDVVDNAALKSQYTGELKFLRALHYFNIVRFWGAAPLVLVPTTAAEAKSMGRNSVGELYTAIESDLTEAIAALPVTYTSTDLGRATQGSAEALLGKVYLTEQKYAQAVTLLKDLVSPSNAYSYVLLPNVADVFSAANKMNAEVIFAVRFNKTISGEGHGLPTYFNQPGIDPKLLSSYSATDTRRNLLNTTTLDVNTAIAAFQNSGLTPISIQAYQYLYPIPQTQINITTNSSGFTQNPGY